VFLGCSQLLLRIVQLFWFSVGAALSPTRCCWLLFEFFGAVWPTGEVKPRQKKVFPGFFPAPLF
jgi:hypothetical protein